MSHFITINPELGKMFFDVLDDYEKKWTALPAWERMPAMEWQPPAAVKQKKLDVTRLEYELYLMHCQLDMVQTEAANQKRVRQDLEDRNHRLEEKNRFLVQKTDSLKYENRSLEDRVISLEDTVHSLEEAVWEKDQMLKDALEVQRTLSSIINVSYSALLYPNLQFFSEASPSTTPRPSIFPSP